MTCVILQPSYIPWRGYFHQIHRADCFVFYDDVQYDRRGWRNRNRIKTSHGSQWLTIPVKKESDKPCPSIREIEIAAELPWNRNHQLRLRYAYHATPFYAQWEPFLEEVYTQRPSNLADFTIDLTIELARRLGSSHTRFLRASELGIPGYRTERLIDITRHLGCDRYLTGPSASAYLDESRFAEAGVVLEYMRYDYPEYPQLHPPFDPRVSILDLLFMTGPDAAKYIWP